MPEKEELKDKDLKRHLVLLSSLREGERGTIHSIMGRRGMISRLAAMGIAPGIEIRVLRNSWGPVIVLSANTRVAIGRGQASKILIAKDQVHLKKEE
ncbi:MAG: FeoA family protein [Thermodesulfovibrionales bacterium]